jgi:sugar O-acyltransferase (sialic acid O-acetyltransferase NeuD family)
MLVLGAKGHAIEVLDILLEQYKETDISFFDDTIKKESVLHSEFIIYNEFTKMQQEEFCLGVGGVKIRKILSSKGLAKKLVWKGIRANNVVIGKYSSTIHSTVDLMLSVTISSNVAIGKGSLINRNVSIHHGVTIGEFCEVAPCSLLLGNVQIDDEVFIGAGAVILPNIRIGKGAVVGAGAIVIKDVGAGCVVVGNPAQ